MHYNQKIFLFVFLFFIQILVFAQWSNNPVDNSPISIDRNNPVKINVISDPSKGAFIIFQSIVTEKFNNIFFLYLNNNGVILSNPEGEPVSLSYFNKLNPIAVITKNNQSVILYKEIISQEKQILSIQKVNSLGLRLWGNFGIQLDKVEGEIISYDLDSNNDGEIFIVMFAKTFNTQITKKTFFKLSADGKILSKYISTEKVGWKIYSPKLIAIDKQRVGFFWLETINNKSVLLYSIKNIVKIQKSNLVTISTKKENVLEYAASKVGNNFYVVWTVHSKNKKLFHQLISISGKKKWNTDGNIVTALRGNNFNPEYIISKQRIILSWVNEFNDDKNIYVAAFKLNGESLWDGKQLPIINIEQDQFSQKIIPSNAGSFIIAWIDKSNKKEECKIFAQKFTINKKFLWDSTGIRIKAATNYQKSYLNLISDYNGGAYVIFKDEHNDNCKIYIHKLYSTGNYPGQILSLKSEVIDNSVKISWYASNELDKTEYQILRKNQLSNQYEIIYTLKKGDSHIINYYQYFDNPPEDGEIEYKIVQKINGREVQESEVTKINYITNTSGFMLFQNSPNPFSDSTTISFFIPTEQKVELEIFDIKLMSVKILLNEHLPAGRHSILLNKENLSSGVYFYRLKTSKFIDVKKMVVN